MGDGEIFPEHNLHNGISRIGEELARVHADDVDRNARFPREVLQQLKRCNILAAPVSARFGGPGASLLQLGEACATLSAHCGSSGLILAMHFVQVECLQSQADRSDYFRGVLSELLDKGLLLGSIASEKGTGGDARQSICALEQSGTRIRLTKDATTASYAEAADGYLVTCRSSPEADASDQLLILFRQADCRLEAVGSWDTLGMRGTCSPPLTFIGSGHREQVFLDSYAQLSSATVVPFAHVLWAAAWEGLARSMVERAVRYSRAKPMGGTRPSNDNRLGAMVSKLKMLQATWRYFACETMARAPLPKAVTDRGFFDWALDFNALKIDASTRALEIASAAMDYLGVAGYRNDSPFSIGRQYRDLLSAPLMVSNERLRGVNSTLAQFSSHTRISA